MTKHSDVFKLAAVEAYLSGVEGVMPIAERYGIHPGLLQEWVAGYREHGVAGVCKKFNYYSAEFKLSILEHRREKKLSQRQTAAIYNIRSRGCLRAWERLYREGGIAALEPRHKGRPRTMSDRASEPPPDIPDDQKSKEQLLKELQQLRMEHAYLKKVDALVRARQAQKERK